MHCNHGHQEEEQINSSSLPPPQVEEPEVEKEFDLNDLSQCIESAIYLFERRVKEFNKLEQHVKAFGKDLNV